jgi:hypothetical protein
VWKFLPGWYVEIIVQLLEESSNTMQKTLAKVPSVVGDPLTIKATAAGITILKEGAFRRRYTGNKRSAVDINGKLWLNAAELKAAISADSDKPKRKPKKKGPVETAPAGNSSNTGQISEDLSTQPDFLLPNSAENKARPRSYTVNKREVRQRLLAFMNTQQGKKELYFWTVTFPKNTPDELAYKMFNIWLTTLRQYRMLRNYLWVAERQDGKRNNYLSATNTIHYHIAIPHRMSVGRANGMMRATIRTFSKRGQIPGYTVNHCRNYNGVDIAKNKKTKRVTNFAIKKGSKALGNYLAKYVAKNDGAFNRLAWHNSRGYSSLFTGVTFTIPEFQKHGFNGVLACDVFTGGASVGDEWRVLDAEFFIFIPWKDDPPDAIVGHLYEVNSYIQNQLQNEHTLPTKRMGNAAA